MNPRVLHHGEAVNIIKAQALYIINSKGIAYHHCESEYSLRLMICTFGDEMHANA